METTNREKNLDLIDRLFNEKVERSNHILVTQENIEKDDEKFFIIKNKDPKYEVKIRSRDITIPGNKTVDLIHALFGKRRKDLNSMMKFFTAENDLIEELMVLKNCGSISIRTNIFNTKNLDDNYNVIIKERNGSDFKERDKYTSLTCQHVCLAITRHIIGMNKNKGSRFFTECFLDIDGFTTMFFDIYQNEIEDLVSTGMSGIEKLSSNIQLELSSCYDKSCILIEKKYNEKYDIFLKKSLSMYGS